MYDIFIIWQNDEEKLLRILYNYPTISFTAEYSLDRVKFLDVEVIHCGNKLLANLHIKHTDTYQYLDFCHVYHSKKSVPYRLTVLIGLFQ